MILVWLYLEEGSRLANFDPIFDIFKSNNKPNKPCTLIFKNVIRYMDRTESQILNNRKLLTFVDTPKPQKTRPKVRQ